MLNKVVINNSKPVLKQNVKLTLKAVSELKSVNIFALPSRIRDSDIVAMFKGLLKLMQEKVQQEQTEKYLKLKLQYSRLKYLYDKKVGSQ